MPSNSALLVQCFISKFGASILLKLTYKRDIVYGYH